MVIYELNPIDWWYGWTPFEEVLTAAAADAAYSAAPSSNADYVVSGAPTADQLRATLARAQKLAKLLNSDTKMREGVYFCPLPENDSEPSAFMHIASPYRLPWLDKDCCDHVDDENATDSHNLERAKEFLRKELPHTVAALLNAAAIQRGIPMRSLRMASRALDMPSQLGIGYWY
jgi:hypothetical protein